MADAGSPLGHEADVERAVVRALGSAGFRASRPRPVGADAGYVRRQGVGRGRPVRDERHSTARLASHSRDGGVPRNKRTHVCYLSREARRVLLQPRRFERAGRRGGARVLPSSVLPRCHAAPIERRGGRLVPKPTEAPRGAFRRVRLRIRADLRSVPSGARELGGVADGAVRAVYRSSRPRVPRRHSSCPVAVAARGSRVRRELDWPRHPGSSFPIRPRCCITRGSSTFGFGR